MSLDLYSTALIWYHRRGAAKLYGRQIQLDRPPMSLGSGVVMIDYRPEIAEARIQRLDGAACDMTSHEIAAADVYLQRALAMSLHDVAMLTADHAV